MSDTNSIISFGNISKPATVLIEKVSEAVGGIFKPYQITRVAKAEAEAELIRAESKVQISELHRRAFYRWIDEEAKKLRNMEEITRKAIPLLEANSHPENVANDWISNFFDKCRHISDIEMQQLWCRVLAGEANAPGSYSKRTVNFLASLDKSDAEPFTQLCTFTWVIEEPIPMIYDIGDNVYRRRNIVFDTLNHLDDIGLIQYEHMMLLQRAELPRLVTASYYGRDVNLEFKKESNNEIDIGFVQLTKMGKELAPICGAQPDWEFFDFIVSKWRQQGIVK